MFHENKQIHCVKIEHELESVYSNNHIMQCDIKNPE